MIAIRTATARILAATALMGGLAACEGATEGDGTVAAMQASDVAVIEERQDNFETIGDAFKVVRGQMESGSPDFAVIATNATTINESARKISGYFPEGSGIDSGADTEALMTIWEDPQEFSTATEQLVTASGALMASAQAGDAAAVAASVKDVGGACKNCHDQFRLDDD